MNLSAFDGILSLKTNVHHEIIIAIINVLEL